MQTSCTLKCDLGFKKDISFRNIHSELKQWSFLLTSYYWLAYYLRQLNYKYSIMDHRLTLGTDESFIEMLTAANAAKEKVYMLVDDGGISRTEGYITEIKNGLTGPLVSLDGKTDISLSKIVAVNGVFRPEYGEC
jgi:hypothetical protein